jgi:putative transposase
MGDGCHGVQRGGRETLSLAGHGPLQWRDHRLRNSKATLFKLVEAMLAKALEGLGSDEKPILHSDQGWQYQMPAYQRRLQTRGVVQSMSRKGNCLDNAAMESFFAILKSELFHPTKFASVQSLQSAITDYIHYYNNDRIKLKLKGLSPVQYRTQSLLS